jgi:hypothetical protein
LLNPSNTNDQKVHLTNQHIDLGVAFRPERVVEDKITIPRPLSYEGRKKGPTLREQWVAQLVEEKRREREEASKYRPFKATRIPYKVQDRQFYAYLIEKENIRRREAKEKCEEMLA